MFNFKPKKVFEKINKMDRKQAYTIGAIAVVLVIALLLLVSAASSGDDDSFAGMKARGYDLAQMPFATDEAEKFLLANAYPDMKENGSTLLYSAAEKEQRQEEDAEAAEEAANEEETEGGYSDDGQYSSGSSSRGYSGYSGGGGSGRGKTEIGQISSAGMASASGSGVSSTWGPSGDFHQFKGREDRGNGERVQLKTADGRQALAQFRSGSMAASRIKENKMRNAGKAVFGGDIRGSDAFGKDGAVDLSKLQSGGLTLDTDAPATTTDLSNLDKKVADAAKKAEDKKKEEDKKRSWWEDMLINLAQSAAETLVNSFMSSVGDTISGTIQGNQASRMARKAEGQRLSSLDYNSLDSADKAFYQKQMQQMGIANANWTNDDYGMAWSRMQGTKQHANLMKNSPSAWGEGHEAKVYQMGVTQSNNAYERAHNTGNQSKNDNPGEGYVRDPKGKTCPHGSLKNGLCP